MENQLQVIIKESGLEQSKAKYILDNFQNYFEVADEKAKKAKTLVVTNETQKAEMQMARTGRLFLREKRIAIEKARKGLKEQALREGKAIDGIANVLKALIIPIEEYLEHQEKFVEIQEDKKREALRLEAEKKDEIARIAQEKAEADERERIRKENERFKKEAEARDKKHRKEQEKAQAEKQAIEEKARKERQELEKKMRDIRATAVAKQEELSKQARIERERIEAQKKDVEEKARKAKEKAQAKAEKDRKEKLRLQEIIKNQITCPKCGHKFQLKKEKK